MKLTIEITMDNAAFADMPGVETASILQGLAKKYEHNDEVQDAKLYDTNGNPVGFARVDG